MKTYLSAFLPLALLLFMSGCSKEQFGGTPKSESNTVEAPTLLEQSSCSTYTLIKPKVDILYVVDNSNSTWYIADDIKNSIKNTINTISSQFDFRVVGINLISNDNQDYQVYSNSSDLTGLPADSRRLSSSSDFTFFNNKADGKETGLARINSFMSSQVGSLFRKGAYHLVILVSNGNDQDVELTYANAQPKVYCVGNSVAQYSCPSGQAVYDVRKQSLVALKNSLQSQQFRIFSVTAPASTSCPDNYLPSEASYRRMSRELYDLSLATDSSSKDTYDLCSGAVNTIFSSVNNAIQQVVIPHKYSFWPMTFASNDKQIGEITSLSDVQVYKYTGSGSSVLIPNTSWTYYQNTAYPTAKNTSVYTINGVQTQGDPVSARHFVQFNSGSEVTYPDCVVIKSKTKLEYFGFVVISQKPDVNKDIVIRINGRDIPQSTSDGWTYISGESPTSRNIKVPYPNSGDENPPVIKSGFMFQLNGVSNYYKSGDSVEVFFSAAPI